MTRFLTIMFFTSILCGGSAQTIYEDFEGGAIQDWVAVDGIYFGQEANPFPGGDNNSSGVGGYKKGIPPFSLFLATLNSAMDLTIENQFTIQVYSPVPSAILMKLESDSGPDIEDIKTISSINEWVQYDFNFSAAENYADLTKIILFFNPGVTGMEDTYFFDYITAYSIALPISLTFFDASYDTKDEKVHLKWKTDQEINNDRFEIQYSFNGGRWQNIASVKGKGNSYVEQEYAISLPLSDAGSYGFRLKQIDFDGNYQISKPTNIHIEQSVVSAYPNPTSDNIVIESIENDFLVLYSLDGRPAKSWEIEKGVNVFEVSQLKKGKYILRNDTGTFVEKIIIK